MTSLLEFEQKKLSQAARNEWACDDKLEYNITIHLLLGRHNSLSSSSYVSFSNL